ncbi:hypothetical protein [Rubinisphaera margarita]|uniref:hypothetical protein n=1 Tax=Rubinisphaera margarita TaxID=2909586 RepID=UPI001EE9A73B|nr:hypothetical protein [Rubinisphaera margarita]MCG6155606.1 hypothetical protein [Rubinisphaera margarita]
MFELMKRKLTSNNFDYLFAQSATLLGSIVICIVGLYALIRLDLSEPETFLGILLVLAVTLLGIICGLLIPIVEQYDAES